MFRTGLIVLLFVTQGLAEVFKERMKSLLEIAMTMAKSSPHSVVRVAAFMCLSEWIEWLGPEIWECCDTVSSRLALVLDVTVTVVD